MKTTKEHILGLLPSEEELLNIREYLNYESHKFLTNLSTSINDKYKGNVYSIVDFRIIDNLFSFNIRITSNSKSDNNEITTLTISNEINKNYPLKITFKSKEFITDNFNDFNIKMIEIIQSENFQNSIKNLLSYSSNFNSRKIIESLKTEIK